MTTLRIVALFAAAAIAEIGGVFVAASLAWGIAVDKFEPDKWDWIGASLALVGAGVIMLAPR